jgi:hypothetical protein
MLYLNYSIIISIVWHHDTIAMMLPERASDVEDADDELYEEDDFPFQANRFVKLYNLEIK